MLCTLASQEAALEVKRTTFSRTFNTTFMASSFMQYSFSLHKFSLHCQINMRDFFVKEFKVLYEHISSRNGRSSCLCILYKRNADVPEVLLHLYRQEFQVMQQILLTNNE